MKSVLVKRTKTLDFSFFSATCAFIGQFHETDKSMKSVLVKRTKILDFSFFSAICAFIGQFHESDKS